MASKGGCEGNRAAPSYLMAAVRPDDARSRDRRAGVMAASPGRDVDRRHTVPRTWRGPRSLTYNVPSEVPSRGSAPAGPPAPFAQLCAQRRLALGMFFSRKQSRAPRYLRTIGSYLCVRETGAWWPTQLRMPLKYICVLNYLKIWILTVKCLP